MQHAGPVSALAAGLGVQESALRLVISLVACYPLAFLHRAAVQTLHGAGVKTGKYTRNVRILQMAYMAAAGVLLAVFYCGLQVYHSLAAVAFTWVSMAVLGRSRALVWANYSFHCGYLLAGYALTATDHYDITWTMPHCILVLKLIGLSMDYRDGGRDRETMSASTKLTALETAPSPLEVAAFAYFPPGFLIGPQFTMRRFLEFVAGDYEGSHVPAPEREGLLRGGLGALYMVGHLIGSSFFPDEHLVSEEFAARSFVGKHVHIALWAKVVFAKYVACWLLAEGACIVCGIAFGGRDGERTKWDGCRNIRVRDYEAVSKFAEYPRCFNVNTNAWVLRNVYKRCAFLGSKQASQAISLLFLAAWHGLHGGYYMAFAMEFVVLMMERDVEALAARYPAIPEFLFGNPVARIVFMAVRRVYVAVFIAWAMVPFCLLGFDRWWPVYRALGYSGFVFFLPWLPIYGPALRFVLALAFGKKGKTDRSE